MMTVRRALFVLTLIAGLALAAGVATSGTRQPFAYCLFQGLEPRDGCAGERGSHLFSLDLGTTPAGLPEEVRVPIALELLGAIQRLDGGHPAALREVTIDLDKDVTIEIEGLPTCAFSQIARQSAGTARHRCRSAIVGQGVAQIGVGLPEARPTVTETTLTLFNGGTRGEVTKLLIHSSDPRLEPVPLVAIVRVTKEKKGPYGLRAIAKIPRIAGGFGSIYRFSFELRRSLLSARCADGGLHARVARADLRGELGTSETFISDAITRPCSLSER